MADFERKDAKLAVLYEFRLLLKKGNKKEYTLEELLALLDKLADAKVREM